MSDPLNEKKFSKRMDTPLAGTVQSCRLVRIAGHRRFRRDVLYRYCDEQPGAHSRDHFARIAGLSHCCRFRHRCSVYRSLAFPSTKFPALFIWSRLLLQPWCS